MGTEEKKGAIHHMSYLLFFGLIPPIALLIYVYHLDRIEKEPPKMILRLFLLGIFSVIPAIFLEGVGMTLLGLTGMPETSYVYLLIEYFLIVAFSEELSKRMIGVGMTYKSEEFNYQFDAAVPLVFQVFTAGLHGEHRAAAGKSGLRRGLLGDDRAGGKGVISHQAAGVRSSGVAISHTVFFILCGRSIAIHSVFAGIRVKTTAGMAGEIPALRLDHHHHAVLHAFYKDFGRDILPCFFRFVVFVPNDVILAQSDVSAFVDYLEAGGGLGAGLGRSYGQGHIVDGRSALQIIWVVRPEPHRQAVIRNGAAEGVAGVAIGYGAGITIHAEKRETLRKHIAILSLQSHTALINSVFLERERTSSPCGA
ncbi:MAG: PrsW family intramembrane metalloprotease, partial [Clostridia bacterium]|nr:PrsW family intramembrane metalloprotease [Clostridia bacterium]